MSQLKVDEILGLSTGDVDITGNVEIGSDADTKNLDISGNLIIDGITYADDRIEAPSIGVNDDQLIPGFFTLTNAKVACAAGGTVTMRESSGSGTLVQAGFVKAYLDDGTTVYIPYFTDTAGS